MTMERILAYFISQRSPNDDSAATAVEYALLIALVCLLLIGALALSSNSSMGSLLDRVIAVINNGL